MALSQVLNRPQTSSYPQKPSDWWSVSQTNCKLYPNGNKYECGNRTMRNKSAITVNLQNGKTITKINIDSAVHGRITRAVLADSSGTARRIMAAC